MPGEREQFDCFYYYADVCSGWTVHFWIQVYALYSLMYLLIQCWISPAMYILHIEASPFIPHQIKIERKADK